MPLPPPDLVRAELATLLADHARADPLYNEFKEAERGRVLNSDLARELSPHYRTWDGRVAFTDCTYPPCRDYVRRRFEAAVTAPPVAGAAQRRVLFLAGGPASGKTRSVTPGAVAEQQLVFDSTFRHLPTAAALVDLVLGHGWDVSVLYVHRPFRRAVEDMIARAVDTGRFLPLYRGGPSDCLADIHFAAQRTFLELNARYADVDQVALAVVENTWSRQTDTGSTEDLNPSDLANGKPRHYKSVDALYGDQAEAIEEVRRSGSVDPRLVAALAGDAG